MGFDLVLFDELQICCNVLTCRCWRHMGYPFLVFGGCGDLPIYQRGYPISIGGVAWTIVRIQKTELNWRGIKTLRDSCRAGLLGISFWDSQDQIF